MRESASDYVEVRGIRYHCRTWGEPGRPILFMLHGFQDVSASWQFTADALARDWYVVAPDWRGYGLSEWSGQDTYWYADLIADLDGLLAHYEPAQPARIVAHSLGGSTASLYAGICPERIEKLLNVEGFGGPHNEADEAPKRYARWLDQLNQDVRQRPYMDFEEFAHRMMAENRHLTEERARFLVEHWGYQDDEGLIWRRADPAHMRARPSMWRVDEAIACWREISAPVLWVEGRESRGINSLRGKPFGYEERLAAFQTLVDVQVVEDAGHNVHHDQPEQLAEIIEAFF